MPGPREPRTGDLQMAKELVNVPVREYIPAQDADEVKALLPPLLRHPSAPAKAIERYLANAPRGRR